MDEIWKNLSLSSLFHPCATTAVVQPPLNRLVFQEVLPCHSKDDVSQSGNFSSNSATGKKRGSAIDENMIENRKKRLMKNREAAVRSRARKQAYTCELEYEVAHLKKENAKLEKQVEELCAEALGYDEHPKKKMLHRTLSNPY